MPRTADPLATISTRATPQNQRAAGPEGERQKQNAAGGYAFAVGDDVRVRRFLTIGTTGGTYYASEKALTADNAAVILAAARTRAEWLVSEIVAVSTAGRAPKQNPAIFALAAASALGDDAGRRAALDALPLVCRTGTHLFLFAGYVEQFRGWGRGLRKAVGAWYLDKPVDQIAYQAVKYRSREGWSHRDLLRLAHPKATPDDVGRAGLFDAIAGRITGDQPALFDAFAQVQATTDVATWVRLIGEHPLSWEMLPDIALTEPKAWAALVEKGMPQTALIRQLPRLTRLGLLADPGIRKTVTGQLQDAERLRKGRVHPVNLLVAQRTYASGHSARGDGTWTPVRQVIDALDAAFYAAFKTIEPTGMRTLLALDVSGSMTASAGGLPVSCREVTAALALVTMAVEEDVTCVGFASADGTQPMWGRDWRANTALRELPLSPRQRLDDAVASISNLPFGGTDCSLPYTWATAQKRAFDVVVQMTDNETWAGNVHPHQALRTYRERMGTPTRQIIVSMTANDVSVGDPLDPLSLDIAGMDASVPNLISDFGRGEL